MKTKDLVRVSIFASLVAISAFFSIDIGPVPISLQSLMVVLAGMILGSKGGALSQVVYVLLGLAGLPIFAGFAGGFGTIFKPSFGFLIGFIPAAYISGKTLEGSSLSRKSCFVAALAGIITPYFIGLPYMYMILNFYMGEALNIIDVLKIGLLPFIIGDTIKIFISYAASYRILPIIKSVKMGGDY